MLIHPYLRRRRWSAPPFIVLAVLLGLTASLGAQAQDVQGICQMRCTPKTPVPPFVEIDANTGAILNGGTIFAEGEKVQVIISRMNPYKYEYEAQIKSTPLDIALVTSFLGLIPGFDNLSSLFPNGSTSGGSRAGGPPATARTLNDDHCAQFESEKQALAALSDDLSLESKAAKDEATLIQTSYKKYETFVLATDKDFLGSVAECINICVDGSQLQPELSRLTDLENFNATLEDLLKSAESLSQKAAKFKADQPTCFPSTIAEIQKNAADTIKGAKAAQASLQELDKLKPALKLLAQRIGKALSDNDSFSVEHYPYTQGEPTDVKITLFRKNMREENAKEKEVGQIQLTVGQSRFSLSAGIGFSTIQDVTIVKIGETFAEENKSDLRPSLTTMLNAQLGKSWWPRSTWGISTGLVLTSRDNSTEVEYIFGPNLGLLDNRFFIVLGYHAARVQSLRSKDIPAASDEIPVVKVWKSGAMLAFTYKIR
jgi:hypothetical protein